MPGPLVVLGDLRSPGDRRREPRHTCHQEIDILPCTHLVPGGFRRATLFSCSANGIGFYAEERVSPGDQFMVMVKRDRVTLMTFTAKYCAQFGEVFWIGAEFNGFADSIGQSDASELIRELCHGTI